jgi:hypothetical protein
MPLPAGTRCDISGCRCSQAWWHMRPLPSGHSVHHRCGGCFQGLGGTRCLTKRALSATLLGACAFIGLMAQDAASSGASIVWWHNRPSLNRHSVRQYWVHVLPGLGGVRCCTKLALGATRLCSYTVSWLHVLSNELVARVPCQVGTQCISIGHTST